jgi:1,4-dihydroxy-2-naphthoate octaprenyltransferase
MNPKPPAAVLPPSPGALRLWWIAARPRTLPLSLTPVLVGLALAWGEGATPRLLVAIATLAAALLIQIDTNLQNDAADFERGLDCPGRIGPLRVTAAGWASSQRVRAVASLAFGLAFLLGIYLAFIGGWPIVAIGLASLAAAYAYSGGPQPISYTPYGELFVWFFFGVLAVAGSHWLQAERLSPAALPASLMVVRNLRRAQGAALNGHGAHPVPVRSFPGHRLPAAHMTISWTPTADYGDIRYELSGDGIAKISINRPARRNAFRPETVMELMDAFARAHRAPDVGVIILTGVSATRLFARAAIRPCAATTAAITMRPARRI